MSAATGERGTSRATRAAGAAGAALTLPGGLTVDDLDFAKQGGLLPAVVQDVTGGRVLMVGYVDRDALRATLTSGLATFFSRSRRRSWVKGEASGNTLTVREIWVDCDQDALLLRCEPAGPTCHTGATSCFGPPDLQPDPFRGGSAEPGTGGFLAELDALVAARHTERPTGSYTTELFESGVHRVAQKVGEEAVETALAAVAQDDETLAGEAADLIYHLLVLLRSRGLSLGDVETVLQDRHSAHRPGEQEDAG